MSQLSTDCLLSFFRKISPRLRHDQVARLSDEFLAKKGVCCFASLAIKRQISALMAHFSDQTQTSQTLQKITIIIKDQLSFSDKQIHIMVDLDAKWSLTDIRVAIYWSQ